MNQNIKSPEPDPVPITKSPSLTFVPMPKDIWKLQAQKLSFQSDELHMLSSGSVTWNSGIHHHFTSLHFLLWHIWFPDAKKKSGSRYWSAVDNDVVVAPNVKETGGTVVEGTGDEDGHDSSKFWSCPPLEGGKYRGWTEKLYKPVARGTAIARFCCCYSLLNEGVPLGSLFPNTDPAPPSLPLPGFIPPASINRSSVLRQIPRLAHNFKRL